MRCNVVWCPRNSEGAKDAAKRVVAGNAVGQVEEGSEPLLVGFAVVGDVNPMLQARQHGTDGNGEDVVEMVVACAVNAGIRDVSENAQHKPVADSSINRSCRLRAKSDRFGVATPSIPTFTTNQTLARVYSYQK
jgi:hypothetical protein